MRVLYRKAYEELRRAHEIAPNDVEVERAWLSVLPAAPATPPPCKPISLHRIPTTKEQTQWMTDSVEFLKQTADQPAHGMQAGQASWSTPKTRSTRFAALVPPAAASASPPSSTINRSISNLIPAPAALW